MALVASAGLLTLLMFAIGAASAHSRTGAMRRELGQIIAVGAGMGFVRKVQLATQGIITGIAAIAAAVVTAVAVGVLLLNSPGINVDPPWMTLLALVCALAVAQLAAGLWALKRIQPETRQSG